MVRGVGSEVDGPLEARGPGMALCLGLYVMSLMCCNILRGPMYLALRFFASLWVPDVLW